MQKGQANSNVNRSRNPQPAAARQVTQHPRPPTPLKKRPESQPTPDYAAAGDGYRNQPPSPAGTFVLPPIGYFTARFRSAPTPAPNPTPAPARLNPAPAPAGMPRSVQGFTPHGHGTSSPAATTAISSPPPTPPPNIAYNTTHYRFCRKCGYGFRSDIVRCICEASHKSR